MFARLLLSALILCGVSARAEVTVERVAEQAIFPLESGAVSDLSGLTWMGDDWFYAVSDQANLLVPILLKIDRTSGKITEGDLGVPVPVPTDASDFEGVAYVTATKSFYISTEQGSAVIRFGLNDAAAQRVAVPGIFARARPNLGLESITWNDTPKNFWIANEESLIPDGQVSGTTGTLVRLQKLDAQFRPVAQYAWRTEPAGFRFRQSGSGVSDLCLLPGGELIVLERSFAGGGLHLRLFLASLRGATDVTKLAALEGAMFVPAAKTLLLDVPTGFTNFEGLALGPLLADGSRSLIAIADSNGGTTHALMPLKIRTNAAPARQTGAPARDSHTQRRDGRTH